MDSTPAAQREIAAEQAYVDAVYERLDASAKVAQSLVAEGMALSHVGNEGALVERDAMVFQATRRLTALNAAHEGLVFGRLDLTEGDPRYIGRIGVRTADRDILLVDWRAPAAALFYQATAQDPNGVVRRRVLRSRGHQVIGVEDDLLDADAAPADMVVVGEGALLASLSRARDVTMHSIVATIQKEQDEAIRAPARGVIAIGGGPGTGKTVVALHRAAYLLYTDRRKFESGGVLVVGPSNVFMAYIERVLPSLGETSVTLRSIGEVVDGVKAGAHDEPVAAAAKGSERMVAVLRRLALDPSPQAPREFRYFYKDDVLRLDERRLAELRRDVLRGAQHNRVLHRAPAVVLDALWAQVSGERALEKEKDGFLDVVADDERFIDFIEGWWPPLDAVELWETLPQRIEELARGAFSRGELDAMRGSWLSGEASVEDVPLIDELRYLLGEVQPVEDVDDDLPKQLMSFERRERDDREERRAGRATQSIEDDGFAHLLVDEAQDLSPMQWRMLGRRGKYASWTIVGDQAQSSWPNPPEAAQARAAALDGKPLHEFRLSTNYRNSAEVYALASEVAAYAIPDADLAEAVRRTGEEPEHLVGEPIETVVHETARMLKAVEGTVAVVVAREHLARVRELLAEQLAAESRLRVLDGLDTKGLEFDGVVIVEPDAIVAEAATGWRTLYVVLTRATQRLVTLGGTRQWLDALA